MNLSNEEIKRRCEILEKMGFKTNGSIEKVQFIYFDPNNEEHSIDQLTKPEIEFNFSKFNEFNTRNIMYEVIKQSTNQGSCHILEMM